MKFPVFDLHCDTAYALLGKNLRQYGSLRTNDGHVDLERAGQLAGYAQCFACFTTTLDCKIPPVELFERELATVMREIEKNSDIIQLAYSAEDVIRNYQVETVFTPEMDRIEMERLYEGWIKAVKACCGFHN